MRSKIHKYALTGAKRQELRVLFGSSVLCVQVQDRKLVLYVQVPVYAALQVPLQVTTVLTGAEVPEDAGPYIGTAMLSDGLFVQHVYASFTEATHG